MLVWVFELGPHLYRSIILHVNSAWVFQDHTYIDRSFIMLVQLEFWNRTYIDRSSSVSIWVFEATPISIDHLPISLSFRNRTYIDWSSSCQFVFSSSWDRTYIDQSLFCQFEFEFSSSGPHLYRSVIHLVSSVRVLGPHLCQSVIVLSVELSLVRLRATPI